MSLNAAVMVLLVFCSSSSASLIASDEVTATAAPAPAAGIGTPYAPLGLDGVFYKLVGDLPGFGGYFFDEDGDLNVFLTDVSQETAARSLLGQIAADRPQRWQRSWARPASIVIRHGQFDFRELAAIRFRIGSDVGGFHGVEMFDTDESKNQVLIGVSTEEARQHVLARISALELPANAITVQLVAPASLTTNVTDYVRPLVGGLEINYTKSDNTVHQCTLGVNVWYSNPEHEIPAGTPGFYTASHCSQTQGHNDSTPYTQGGVHIATEAYDPPLFSHQDNPTFCIYLQSNIRCRFSDVLFAAYDTNPPPAHNQGYLAQTTYPGVGVFQTGSLQLASPIWQFTITSTTLPLQGFLVDKIGRTTGWTEGTIANTCADLVVGSNYTLCSEIVIITDGQVVVTAELRCFYFWVETMSHLLASFGETTLSRVSTTFRITLRSRAIWVLV